jgi:aldehyde dehydrogenase family protein
VEGLHLEVFLDPDLRSFATQPDYLMPPNGATSVDTMPVLRPTMLKGPQFTIPIVLTEATTDMVLAHQETFGPIAPLFRFETDEEAIAIANATPFGLAAYLYTRDLKRSWRVAEALEAGVTSRVGRRYERPWTVHRRHAG